MVELVGVLATYSVTIKELKYFLASLQVGDDNKWVSESFTLHIIVKVLTIVAVRLFAYSCY